MSPDQAALLRRLCTEHVLPGGPALPELRPTLHIFPAGNSTSTYVDDRILNLVHLDHGQLGEKDCSATGTPLQILCMGIARPLNCQPIEVL